MRRPLQADSPEVRIVAEELALLARVQAHLHGRNAREAKALSVRELDRELIALRDQMAEEKLEDLPILVEQMTRVQALAGTMQAQGDLPVDAASPYFAHLRVRVGEDERDVLLGKRGYIERAEGIQIVDWRDAPISQVYYRYDEGDDYDETVNETRLRGEVLLRRSLSITDGKLTRVACPQGTFVCQDGQWSVLDADSVELLEGGTGSSARPPKPQPPTKKRRHGFEDRARAARQLPEIAALIDREQFELVSQEPSSVVVIQGGAGTGKTTVALHRIAYLVFHHSAKPSRCLFVVPSRALERYVSGVLPALGVHGVGFTAFRGWAENMRHRLLPQVTGQYADETPPLISRIKKHPALLQVLVRAVEDETRAIEGALAASPDALRWWQQGADQPLRVRLRAVRGLIQRSETAHGLHSVDQALKRAQQHLLDLHGWLGEILTDRTHLKALTDISDGEIETLVRWELRQMEDRLPPEWEGVDEDRLQPVDGRALDEGEVAGRIDEEDDSLLLRLYQLVNGGLRRRDHKPLTYDHIAVDEAQDLAAVDIQVLFTATPSHSFTIAGDVAQRVIFDNAFSGWAPLIETLGISHVAQTHALKLIYRSTLPVMHFAQALLGEKQEEGNARSGAPVGKHAFSEMGEAVAFVAEALRSLLGREPQAAVGVLTRFVGQADAWHAALQRAEVPQLRRVKADDFAFLPGVDVAEIGRTKGLEYDYVLLCDVNEASFPDTMESRHLLHIGATRATHQLWVISTGKPSGWVDASLVAAEDQDQDQG